MSDGGPQRRNSGEDRRTLLELCADHVAVSPVRGRNGYFARTRWILEAFKLLLGSSRSRAFPGNRTTPPPSTTTGEPANEP